MALSRRALRHSAYMANAITELEGRIVALEAAGPGGGLGDMSWDSFKAIVADAEDWAAFATSVSNYDPDALT